MNEDRTHTQKVSALKKDLATKGQISREDMHALAAKHDLDWKVVMAVAHRVGQYEADGKLTADQRDNALRGGKPKFGLFVTMLVAGAGIFAIPALLVMAYVDPLVGLISWAALAVVLAAGIAGYTTARAGYWALVGALLVLSAVVLVKCTYLGTSGLAEPPGSAGKACSDLGGKLSGDECRF